MKTRKKILITIDLLFLIPHMVYFIVWIISGIDFEEPFYLFMNNAYFLPLIYAFTSWSLVIVIIDFTLMFINICLFIIVCLKKEEKDKTFPIIATYAIFSGLAYISILIRVLNVLMS